ncbi:MAG TPA: hypothetical protein VF365_02585 [Candidatus Limnocylindria bacterium]
MDPSQLLLAQTLSLSGLLGASGAYAGVVRRRQERRIEMQASADASQAAVERVDRTMALARLRRTFTPSVYQDRATTDRRRRTP